MNTRVRLYGPSSLGVEPIRFGTSWAVWDPKTERRNDMKRSGHGFLPEPTPPKKHVLPSLTMKNSAQSVQHIGLGLMPEELRPVNTMDPSENPYNVWSKLVWIWMEQPCLEVSMCTIQM